METPHQALKRRVDEIIAIGNRDPEEGHGKEDELLTELVIRYAPHWAVGEMERLAAADFSRWYA